LNEPADSLTYTINGGAPQTLDGSIKGTKTFALGSPGDKFAISAQKLDSVGWTVPTGATFAATPNGLSQPTSQSGFRLISTDTDNLVKFNSPRGVNVNLNPNTPNFGTTYVANSAAGTTGGRSVGDGIYALHADQSDAFGYGNTAQNVSAWTANPSASSPWKLSVAPDGNVYVADFTDTTGNVWKFANNLTGGTQVLAGTGGPSAVPAGQYHGSATAVYAEGTGPNFKLYTIDEDLTPAGVPGAGAGTDKLHVWRYDIGNNALPDASVPTKVNAGNSLLINSSNGVYRGADGKTYISQSRAAGNEPGIFVLNTDGTTAFDSLTASRTLLANPTAADIFRNVMAIAVSPDQKWLAALLNSSDIGILPLVNGIPDMANRLVVDTGTDIISGRDIAFDAVDNIHYVSSGQALYRELSPGGFQSATTSWDGSSYSLNFTQLVPEPSSIAAIGLAAAAVLGRRRRA